MFLLRVTLFVSHMQQCNTKRGAVLVHLSPGQPGLRLEFHLKYLLDCWQVTLMLSSASRSKNKMLMSIWQIVWWKWNRCQMFKCRYMKLKKNTDSLAFSLRLNSSWKVLKRVEVRTLSWPVKFILTKFPRTLLCVLTHSRVGTGTHLQLSTILFP